MLLLLVALALLGSLSQTFGAGKGQGKRHGVAVLHTYGTESATEVINTIPVSAANLVPLLPDGYELIPAAALGLGGWDQGIVVMMIENHRSRLIWDLMRSSQHIRRGLGKAGFTGGWLSQPASPAPGGRDVA